LVIGFFYLQRLKEIHPHLVGIFLCDSLSGFAEDLEGFRRHAEMLAIAFEETGVTRDGVTLLSIFEPSTHATVLRTYITDGLFFHVGREAAATQPEDRGLHIGVIRVGKGLVEFRERISEVVPELSAINLHEDLVDVDWPYEYKGSFSSALIDVEAAIDVDRFEFFEVPDELPTVMRLEDDPVGV
jgi:hypothetical protein